MTRADRSPDAASHAKQSLQNDHTSAPQDRKAEGALKRLITEDTLFIEPKGINPFEVPNRLHPMVASNHNWVIAASEKERRYAAQKVSEAHQQEEAWFKPIYQELRHGGLEAMLFDLLAHDLGDWRPRQIVRTDALGRQMDESLNPFDLWWLELLQTGVLTGARGAPNMAISNAFEEEIEEEEIIEGEGIYGGKQTRTRKRTVMRSGLFDQARRISPKLKSESDTALGRFLGNKGCVNAWVRRHRGWRFPALADCRDSWFARFPHTVWPDPSPADWTFGDEEA
jgi:Family of unknown function (DUF5906)